MTIVSNTDRFDPRSIMFVSPLSEKHLAKAPLVGADAIQLDLEDAIAPDDKVRARESLRDAITGLRNAGVASIIVRVNSPWQMAVEDIKAAVDAGANCITLPKVETSDRVSTVSDLLDELEAESSPSQKPTRLLVLIESPLGLENLSTILRASPRVSAVTLGPEDFAKEVGGMTTIEGNEWANIAVLCAARAAGVTPLGFPGSITVIKDMDLFRSQVVRARELGFHGAAVVHPAQVAVLNEMFSPSATDVAEARRIVEAADMATSGAFIVDGKMVDAPIVDRARATLLRAERTN